MKTRRLFRDAWPLIAAALALTACKRNDATLLDLEVVTPGASPGLRATSVDDATGERRRLTLVGATWTSAPGPTGGGTARLLRFIVDLPRVWRGEVHGFRSSWSARRSSS